MAEHSTVGAPALSTNIESGNFDEKAPHHDPAAKQPIADEEEDEDMDALIEDLESNDGHGDVSYFFRLFLPPRCAIQLPSQLERARKQHRQTLLRNCAFATIVIATKFSE